MTGGSDSPAFADERLQIPVERAPHLDRAVGEFGGKRAVARVQTPLRRDSRALPAHLAPSVCGRGKDVAHDLQRDVARAHSLGPRSRRDCRDTPRPSCVPDWARSTHRSRLRRFQRGRAEPSPSLPRSSSALPAGAKRRGRIGDCAPAATNRRPRDRPSRLGGSPRSSNLRNVVRNGRLRRRRWHRQEGRRR